MFKDYRKNLRKLFFSTLVYSYYNFCIDITNLNTFVQASIVMGQIFLKEMVYGSIIKT